METNWPLSYGPEVRAGLRWGLFGTTLGIGFLSGRIPVALPINEGTFSAQVQLLRLPIDLSAQVLWPFRRRRLNLAGEVGLLMSTLWAYFPSDNQGQELDIEMIKQAHLDVGLRLAVLGQWDFHRRLALHIAFTGHISPRPYALLIDKNMGEPTLIGRLPPVWLSIQIGLHFGLRTIL
jgi:hypothetical protein